MSNFYNILTKESYIQKRFDVISLLEGNRWNPYLDNATPKVPTIGYGFNITIKENFELVAGKIAPALSPQQIGELYNAINGKVYTTNIQLRKDLNSKMALLHNENPAIPNVFAFTSDNDVKDLFENKFAANYEKYIPSYVEDSKERAVLFSMVYNAGDGLLVMDRNADGKIDSGKELFGI